MARNPLHKRCGKSTGGADTSPQNQEIADSAPHPREKPVSLHPLDFKEALKDLLRVKPDEGAGERPKRRGS